jgi:hypothetical protein
VSRVIARIATIEHECGGLKIAVIHGRTAAVGASATWDRASGAHRDPRFRRRSDVGF